MLAKILNCGKKNDYNVNMVNSPDLGEQKRKFRVNFIISGGFTYIYEAFLKLDLREYLRRSAVEDTYQAKSLFNIFVIVKTYVDAFILASSKDDSALRTFVIKTYNSDSSLQTENIANILGKTPALHLPVFGPLNIPTTKLNQDEE